MVDVNVIEGILPTKVPELMFVSMAIKEVLLVFILSVEAFIVLLKKIPVVVVDVNVNVEMLLVSVFEFKILSFAFTVTLVELILRLVELRLALVISPLKMVEFTSKFGAFILAFWLDKRSLSEFIVVFLFVVPNVVPFES